MSQNRVSSAESLLARAHFLNKQQNLTEAEALYQQSLLKQGKKFPLTKLAMQVESNWMFLKFKTKFYLGLTNPSIQPHEVSAKKQLMNDTINGYLGLAERAGDHLKTEYLLLSALSGVRFADPYKREKLAKIAQEYLSNEWAGAFSQQNFEGGLKSHAASSSCEVARYRLIENWRKGQFVEALGIYKSHIKLWDADGNMFYRAQVRLYAYSAYMILGSRAEAEMVFQEAEKILSECGVSRISKVLLASHYETSLMVALLLNRASVSIDKTLASVIAVFGDSSHFQFLKSLSLLVAVRLAKETGSRSEVEMRLARLQMMLSLFTRLQMSSKYKALYRLAVCGYLRISGKKRSADVLSTRLISLIGLAPIPFISYLVHREAASVKALTGDQVGAASLSRQALQVGMKNKWYLQMDSDQQASAVESSADKLHKTG